MSLTRKLLSSLAIAWFTCFATVGNAIAQPTMQSLERPKVSTPLSPTRLLNVLRQAHVELRGEQPSRSRLAMAWAQVALENAQGKVMWNYNVGNVTPGKNGMWYRHSPKARYRSFDNFVDGAKVYWRVVMWCKAAFKMFDAGQPIIAATNLKKCGYFEADLEPYTKGLSSLYHHAIKTIIPNEEREQREEEQARNAKIDYDLRTSRTPRCACCEAP